MRAAAIPLLTTILLHSTLALIGCGGAPTTPSPVTPIKQLSPATALIITPQPTPTFTIILLSDLQPPTPTSPARQTATTPAHPLTPTTPTPLANLVTLRSPTPTVAPLPNTPTPAPTTSPTRIPTSIPTIIAKPPTTPTSIPSPTATKSPTPALTPTIAATQTPAAPNPSKTPTLPPLAIPASITSETPAPNPSETPATPTPSTTPAPTPSETPAPSATPTPAPTSNPDCRIKGNISSNGNRVYHTPDSPYYARTHIDPAQGERWFCTEQDAQAAGWRPPGATRATPSADCAQIVHINTADAATLETLPGIGETLAQRILDHRHAITAFTTVEQLTDIKGIGEKTLEKIRPCISLD